MQTEIDKIALGKLLRSLRTQKGLNQKELARQLNVAVGTVSKWETGVNLPDTPTLCDLADFYGILVDDLFHPGRTHGEPSSPTAKKDTALFRNGYFNANRRYWGLWTSPLYTKFKSPQTCGPTQH